MARNQWTGQRFGRIRSRSGRTNRLGWSLTLQRSYLLNGSTTRPLEYTKRRYKRATLILPRGSKPRRSPKSSDYADALEQAIPNVLERKPWTDKIEQARRAIEISTAWRVEGTLGVCQFKPINMWFSYPVHFLDDSGVLADIKLDDDKPGWLKAKETRKRTQRKTKAKADRV